VGDINLPPVEPLALRTGIAMMVVMPSLAKGDDREDEAVLTVVTCLESSFSEYVSERVNAERTVIEQGRTDAKSPCKHLKGAGPKFRVVRLKEVAEPRDPETKKHRWHNVVSLKETELGKLNEILHKLPSCLNELRAQYPTNVRPPHAVDPWGMYIFFGVRELMVMTVV
jgi:hypothetical protein